MPPSDIHGTITIVDVVALAWILIAACGVFVILRALLDFLRRMEEPGEEARRREAGAERRMGK